MKRRLWVALILAGCLGVAPRLSAQAPANGEPAQSGQSKPAADAQKPAAAPQSGSNPFPEDTSTVPVLPTKIAPPLPEGTYEGPDDRVDSAHVSAPGADADPVRSPDDPAPDAGVQADSSSSLNGLDNLLPRMDDEQAEKKRKLAVKEPTHTEAASKDLEVGSYYMDRKNWKAALSRFESAMVLDPENPEIYWGLAEAERNLGDFAQARAYYTKVLDYDPDGPHGKQARKALKDPAIAGAKNPPSGQSAPEPQR